MMKKSGRHHEKRYKEVSNQIKKLGVSHSSAKFSKDVEVIVYEPMTELLSKTQRNQLHSSRNEGVFCVQVDDINEYLRLFEAERKKREEDAAKKEKVEKAAQRGKQIVGQRGQQIAGRRKKKTKQKKTTDGLVNILNDRLLFPNDVPKDRVEMLERIFLGANGLLGPNAITILADCLDNSTAKMAWKYAAFPWRRLKPLGYKPKSEVKPLSTDAVTQFWRDLLIKGYFGDEPFAGFGSLDVLDVYSSLKTIGGQKSLYCNPLPSRESLAAYASKLGVGKAKQIKEADMKVKKGRQQKQKKAVATKKIAQKIENERGRRKFILQLTYTYPEVSVMNALELYLEERYKYVYEKIKLPKNSLESEDPFFPDVGQSPRAS
ncbi:hypothetical protein TrST_g3676 [Triparma strigata]|uniref:Uncharacterized protein n=1 Tax=Triparma strigata TaxID=1606541 RepID=A0A9W7ERI1_9STRA|nr:hypothetical protein TrST_g3676 [Triparma strigata]